MTRPVILLDVDGVLNAYRYDDRNGEGFGDFQTAECYGYQITYSQKMGDRLAALDADIVWHTTWAGGNRCNTEIGPLFGWGNLPVLAEPGWGSTHGDYYWWKLDPAFDYIRNNPRPFVWIDDDLLYEFGAENTMKSLCQPCLLIAPSPHTGITVAEMERIEEFVNANAE